MKNQNGVLSNKDWQEVNRWEAQWWGDCTNTFIEETKHMKVMANLGLTASLANAHLWVDLQGKNIVDIGGGVVSILLKCKNKGDVCSVVDPILDNAPRWIIDRYSAAGIMPLSVQAEEYVPSGATFDEVWLYNVLQHTQDPVRILENIKKSGVKVIRIHEWLNTPPANGHPQTITKEMIDDALGIDVKVKEVESGDSNLVAVGVYQL